MSGDYRMRRMMRKALSIFMATMFFGAALIAADAPKLTVVYYYLPG